MIRSSKKFKKDLPSKEKAKKMLRDGTAHGKPLTKKQKAFLGWVAGGAKAQEGINNEREKSQQNTEAGYRLADFWNKKRLEAEPERSRLKPYDKSWLGQAWSEYQKLPPGTQNLIEYAGGSLIPASGIKYIGAGRKTGGILKESRLAKGMGSQGRINPRITMSDEKNIERGLFNLGSQGKTKFLQENNKLFNRPLTWDEGSMVYDVENMIELNDALSIARQSKLKGGDLQRAISNTIGNVKTPILNSALPFAATSATEDVPELKGGGKNKKKIYIKPSKRGSFTKWCGGKVTGECIARGLKSKDKRIKMKAVFAKNSRGWDHKKS